MCIRDSTSTIHKKGSKNTFKNYRGITVTSTLSRLYERVLKHFLEAEYKEMEADEQAGDVYKRQI